MPLRILLSQQSAAGTLLILSSLIFAAGGTMYAGRVILKWEIGQTHSFLLWERGLVIAAVVGTALGLVLLEGLLKPAGDGVFASLGMAAYLIAAALVIAAETFSLGRQSWAYAPIVVYVVLAFLAQAAFGASILQTGFLPAWVGWATIVWNLAWMVILPITRPQDMYYPWLHHTAPLVIGIALLLKQ